jgi:hypothetical protein
MLECYHSSFRVLYCHRHLACHKKKPLGEKREKWLEMLAKLLDPVLPLFLKFRRLKLFFRHLKLFFKFRCLKLFFRCLNFKFRRSVPRYCEVRMNEFQIQLRISGTLNLLLSLIVFVLGLCTWLQGCRTGHFGMFQDSNVKLRYSTELYKMYCTRIYYSSIVDNVWCRFYINLQYSSENYRL